MGSDSLRKWQMVQDLLVVVLGPVVIYYTIRKVLQRQQESQNHQENNPEITKRLEGILADRAQEQDDYEAYSSDFSSNSSDTEGGYYSSSSSSNTKSTKRRRKRRTRPRKTPRTPPPALNLTPYEQSIAQEVIQPSSIPVTFADIGGLDAIISDLQESVIYPLTLPSLYASSSSYSGGASSTLLSAPSGVLLYGPPGCGKTMLAKALARESNAAFINLHISTLTNKWYGDSNKLVAAVFTLARKLAPAIVFIDEIDAVLGSRGRGSEHEASGMVKAEMMTHWDGLGSVDAEGKAQRVLVLGATNRPRDIDEAILRRMPKRFEVRLPDASQRRRIFGLVLRGTKLDVPAPSTDDATSSSTNGAPVTANSESPIQPPKPTAPLNGTHAFDIETLVRASAGMSGSDIKEACREAAMAPMREFIQARKASGKSMRGVRSTDLRGLRTGDFAMSGWRHGEVEEEVDEYEDFEDEEEGEEDDGGDEPARQGKGAASSRSRNGRGAKSRVMRRKSKERRREEVTASA